MLEKNPVEEGKEDLKTVRIAEHYTDGGSELRRPDRVCQ